MMASQGHRGWGKANLKTMLPMVAGLILAACASGPTLPPPSEMPLSKEAMMQLGRKGMTSGAPIFIRIFKEESELEVWKQREDGRFYHFKTYPICNWSGELGPKIKQGDKQAPEGFYTVSGQQMNPNSSFYLSFNIGFPNAYDRAQSRSGDFLMVHGKCRSAGCYAMTDALMEEIYALSRDALRGGQTAFHVHAFPFRLTDANLARHAKNTWLPFWQTLKEGYDSFEMTRIPPDIAVCERRYVVNVTLPQTRIDPERTCPRFQRPVVTAFVPLPVQPQVVAASAPGAATPPATPPSAAIEAAATAGAPAGRAPGPAAVASGNFNALGLGGN